MEILSQSSLLRSWMLGFSVILLTVSVSEADYNFTVRFHEFRNPLGLQCGACGSGGPPACCDDLLQENCINIPPRTCDTRFRFILRQFGASVETAPTGSFPHFTTSNGGNSDIFNEGPGAFLGLPNPFNITNTTVWTGRIQFFIDALDRAVSGSGLSETEVIINSFLIDLELPLGPNFTARANYTGIYNISDMEFDISFRVQCLEDYYGSDCNTFCVPLEGVYTCDSEGRFVCLEENREPATNCTTCLPGYNGLRNCRECLLGRDITTNCVTCLTGHDPSTNCTECLPGYIFNAGGTQCIKRPTEGTMAAPTGTPRSESSVNLRAVSGVVGVIAAVLLIVLVVVIVLIVLYLRRQKEEKSITSDTTEAQTGTAGGRSAEEHDVENPLYGGTEPGTKTELEEKQDLSENPYTELDHSPKQKPSEQSSFPYNTLEHSEDTPQKVDLAEQGAYDNTIDEPVQTQPPDEASTANGTAAANGTTHESSDMLSAVLEEGPKPSPSALAGGIYDIPPQESAATEATTSEPPPDIPAEHEYAETEINRQPLQPDSEEQSMATYTNTTPGLITQEAINHYDLGQ